MPSGEGAAKAGSDGGRAASSPSPCGDVIRGYGGVDVVEHYRARCAGQLHPDADRLARRFCDAAVPTYDALPLGEARQLLDAVVKLQTPPPAIARVEDLDISVAGGAIRIRLYHPEPSRTLPVVVYLHGGGWTLGGLQAVDGPCRRLSLAGHCAVVSVDYRLAPEHPFPVPLEDCLAAVRWVARHGDELGVDGARLVVLGDSAGGNLAAAVSHSLALAGERLLTALILLYPCLLPAGNNPFASYREHADGPFMTAREMTWFWNNYLGCDSAGDDPLAAPLLASRYDGLPPTTMVLAEIDVLRDEGLAYAERLRRAGVEVDVLLFPGAVHGFWWMDAAMAQAGQLDKLLGEQIRALGGQAKP